MSSHGHEVAAELFCRQQIVWLVTDVNNFMRLRTGPHGNLAKIVRFGRFGSVNASKKVNPVTQFQYLS
jgi:hypothetical protein